MILFQHRRKRISYLRIENLQKPYSFSAARTYIAHTGEYPSPPGGGGRSLHQLHFPGEVLYTIMHHNHGGRQGPSA